MLRRELGAGLLLACSATAPPVASGRAQRPLAPSAAVGEAAAPARTASLEAPAVLVVSTPSKAEQSLRIGGAEIRVHFDENRLGSSRERLLGWVERCARAVTEYYARFPVPEVDVQLHAVPGAGLRGGHTDADPQPVIELDVGERTSAEDFERNWSLTHEMVHLALPNLARRHHWLEEGLASYVEPIARTRVHWLDEARVWREWMDNFGRGLPEPGDRGLDHTPTWGRTYWGGALFSFLADLEIRTRTHNRYELRDALRAILAAGGNLTQSWPIERVLATGDAATGTHVLEELYAAHKDAPVPVDLALLWRDLGVRERGREILYDDAAPLAGIRRSFVVGR